MIKSRLPNSVSASNSEGMKKEGSKKIDEEVPKACPMGKEKESVNVALQDASDWQHPPNPAPGFLEMMHKAQQAGTGPPSQVPVGKGKGPSKFTRSAPPFRPGSSWQPTGEAEPSLPQLMIPSSADSLNHDVMAAELQSSLQGFCPHFPLFPPQCFPGGLPHPQTGSVSAQQQHAALVQYQKAVQQAVIQAESLGASSALLPPAPPPPPPVHGQSWPGLVVPGTLQAHKSALSNKDAPEFVPRAAKLKKTPKHPFSKSSPMAIRVIVTHECVKLPDAPPQILGAAKVFGYVNRFDCRKFSKSEPEPSVSIRFACAESATNAKNFMKNILPAVSPKLGSEFIVDIELEDEVFSTGQGTNNNSSSAGGSGAVTPGKGLEDLGSSNALKSMIDSLSTINKTAEDKSQELMKARDDTKAEWEVIIEPGMLAILGALTVRCPWFSVDDFLAKFGLIVQKKTLKSGAIAVSFNASASAAACRLAIPALKEALSAALLMIPFPPSFPEEPLLPPGFSNQGTVAGVSSGLVTPQEKNESFIPPILQQSVEEADKTKGEPQNQVSQNLEAQDDQGEVTSLEENSTLAAIIAMAMDP